MEVQNPFKGIHGSDQQQEVRVGVYVCRCGTNIGGIVDVEQVVDFVSNISCVAVAREYSYMCSDPGQGMIKEDIETHDLNRVVVASCSPVMHESTFKTACAEAGINPFFFQMANIREHVSWVHSSDPVSATKKAKDLVSAAVNRAIEHLPLEERQSNVKQSALVVGAGIAGIEAALRIADSGKQVYLVERQSGIGGHMARLYKTFPTLDCAA